MPPVPAPGSPEAAERGCSCPREENQHGKGAHIVNATPGKVYFAVDSVCEMHGFEAA